MLVQLSYRHCCRHSSTQATVRRTIYQAGPPAFVCTPSLIMAVCVVLSQNMQFKACTTCTAAIRHTKALCLLFVTCYNQLLLYLWSGNTLCQCWSVTHSCSLICWQWWSLINPLLSSSFHLAAQRNSLWLHAAKSHCSYQYLTFCVVCCACLFCSVTGWCSALDIRFSHRDVNTSLYNQCCAEVLIGVNHSLCLWFPNTQ